MNRRRLELTRAAALVSVLASSALPASAEGAQRWALPVELRCAASVLTQHSESFALPGGRVLPVRMLTRQETAEQFDRLVSTTSDALALLTAWLGPYPADDLTVVDVPWPCGLAGAAFPWGVVTSTRWMAVARDRTADRSLIAALARAFWPAAGGSPSDGAFVEGLRLYTAARAIHELLDGRNFATPRFLGGFVPLPRREVGLSVSPAHRRIWGRRVAEVVDPAAAEWRAETSEPGGDADRAAAALQTLERFIGWPALQQALGVLHATLPAAPTRAALQDIVEAQRGDSMRWFFDTAFQRGIRFDYGVDALVSASRGAGEPFVTVVRVRRYGDGVFAGTDRPGGASFGDAKPVRIALTLADGSETDVGWDGRAALEEITIEASSPAVTAAVDPDGAIQLDADRSNNRRSVAAAPAEPGTRLSAHWWLWLQAVMLAATGLV